MGFTSYLSDEGSRCVLFLDIYHILQIIGIAS